MNDLWQHRDEDSNGEKYSCISKSWMLLAADKPHASVEFPKLLLEILYFVFIAKKAEGYSCALADQCNSIEMYIFVLLGKLETSVQYNLLNYIYLTLQSPTSYTEILTTAEGRLDERHFAEMIADILVHLSNLTISLLLPITNKVVISSPIPSDEPERDSRVWYIKQGQSSESTAVVSFQALDAVLVSTHRSGTIEPYYTISITDRSNDSISELQTEWHRLKELNASTKLSLKF